LPQRSCLCHWIRATENTLPLLILQHPQERTHPKGSARLLGLSLRHCRIEVGEAFDPAALQTWISAPAPGSTRPVQALLLYPAAEPVPCQTDPPQPQPQAPATKLVDPAGWRLVLLDGTWRQSRQLLRANPLLQRLPRWPLPQPAPSRYAIRKAQRPDQRSTLEAACAALAALEGDPGRCAPLLAAFDGWVGERARWSAGAVPQRG